ncbi:MAG: hypothetical protein Q7T26_08770 [Dehalococcoidia bacterium]|nr:hypothetical protein [Dehalococcoidia bacterium]
MPTRHIIAALVVVVAALFTIRCGSSYSEPWMETTVPEPAPTAAPEVAAAPSSTSALVVSAATEGASSAEVYPRWERAQVDFNPGALNPTGGNISATIKTQDKEAPAITSVTFILTRQGGVTEEKAATSCGTTTQSNVVSRCWEVTFTIPANSGSTPQEYKVTGSSPSIASAQSGAFTIPAPNASKSCTGISVDFN